MENTLPISIIVPVHNGADRLSEALESVLSQTRECDDVIVVDDGSSDDSAELARQFPVRVIVQSQQGPAVARNRGISASAAPLIGFIDHDDLWPAGKLELQMAAFCANPDVEIVTGQYQLWLLDNGHQCRYGAPAFGPNLGAAFYRRELFARFGMLDASCVPSEDVDWYLRLREGRVKMHVLPEVVLHYRLHHTNLTGDRARARTAFFRVIKDSIDRRAHRPLPQRESPAPDRQRNR